MLMDYRGFEQSIDVDLGEIESCSVQKFARGLREFLFEQIDRGGHAEQEHEPNAIGP